MCRRVSFGSPIRDGTFGEASQLRLPFGTWPMPQSLAWQSQVGRVLIGRRVSFGTPTWDLAYAAVSHLAVPSGTCLDGLTCLSWLPLGTLRIIPRRLSWRSQVRLVCPHLPNRGDATCFRCVAVASCCCAEPRSGDRAADTSRCAIFEGAIARSHCSFDAPTQ